MRKWTLALAVVVLVTVIAGWQREGLAQKAFPSTEGVTEFAVGQNTAGESCSARLAEDRADAIPYQTSTKNEPISA